jgi:hypothetical protein
VVNALAYIKQKEITKYFDFNKYIPNENLPHYLLDYVYEDEKILAVYKTFRDHGVFTTKKMVLFDNAISIDPFKQIYTIPYKNISSCSIVFRSTKAELKCDLISGYPLRLKFINIKVEDKVRLRLLYSCIARLITDQKLDQNVVSDLSLNKINLKEELK